ncbi:hypothetical protein G9A89_004883 [Geosiphon pyriformis]|nr:hypothetical protein G9A89_004883 [Geosiphon pyriformis]
MSQKYNKDLDVVIFGATGFTGKLVVEEFCRAAHLQFDDNARPKFTWAIAGRLESKLNEIANIINLTTNANSIRQPEIIVADVTNPASLAYMVKRTKVLIACVGPFNAYGEPVVKACVEHGTDYVDITGETQFIERIQLTYHETAKANNVTIVPACGFDSVPSDIGFLYTKRQLESRGVLPCSIEFFFKLLVGPAGHTLNFGTYESLINALADLDSIRRLRASANRPTVPKVGPILKRITSGTWEKRVNGYVIPFLFADPSVIRLSQELDIEHHTNTPPVQFAGYVVISKLVYLFEMMIGFKIFSFLVKYSWGRRLLLKFPKIFSFGLFSHDGPSLEQIRQTSFVTTFYAHGFSKERINNFTEESTETTPLIQNGTKFSPALMTKLSKEKPDVEIITQVSAPEPGYAATPIIVVQCAFTLLLEKAKIPPGVLTTSVAFGKTNLLEKLNENGIIFSTLEVRDNHE